MRIDHGHVVLLLPDVDVTSLPCISAPDVGTKLDAYLRRQGVVVEPGGQLSAYGTIEQTENVFADGYRDAPRRVLRMRGTPEDPLVLLPV